MQALSSEKSEVNQQSALGKGLRLVHTSYGMFWFGILFLIFFPLLCIPIVWRQKHGLVGVFNRWWARLFFTGLFIPLQVEKKGPLDPAAQYIFCPNHFSYLDIPTLGLNPHNAIFVGKNDMERIPLFGFMYRKLHITVDRNKLRSRYSTLIQSRQALDNGRSLVIFPEGGIVTQKAPFMHPFKDGAFRLAIEKQIPIVPVTIPYNWILLPDTDFLLQWHPLKVIFHTPVHTQGLTLDDLDQLKQRVYDIINDELSAHNQHED